MTDKNNEALDDYSDPTDKHGDCKICGQDVSDSHHPACVIPAMREEISRLDYMYERDTEILKKIIREPLLK